MDCKAIDPGAMGHSDERARRSALILMGVYATLGSLVCATVFVGALSTW